MKGEKERALNDFVKKITSNYKDFITHIVLFGSVARGDFTKESDIDVLVVTFKNGALNEKLKEFAVNTLIERGELIQVFTVHLNDYLYPSDYFIYHIKENGKEVYKMKKEELKEKMSLNYQKLAEDYINGAKKNLEMGEYRIAVDTSYNACELLIKSMLIKEMDTLPKTHGGLLSKFSELFVKTGKIPKEIVAELYDGLNKRNDARYVYDKEIRKEDAEKIINLYEELKKLL